MKCAGTCGVPPSPSAPWPLPPSLPLPLSAPTKHVRLPNQADLLLPAAATCHYLPPCTPGLLFSLLMTTAARRRLVSSMLPDRVVEALAQGREYVEDFKNVTIMFADIAQVSHG